MAEQVTGELYRELDGQLHELKRQLRQPNGYPFDPYLLKVALQNAIEGKWSGLGPANVILDWTKVYEKLGIKPDFPFGEAEPGHWDVYVARGVTLNSVVKVLRDLGVEVWLYYDLDKEVRKNDRDPAKGSYKVTFRQNIEADADFANKSANDLAKMDVQGTTLLERLLLELAYFIATGKHLDVENVTLCAGSRYSDGDVPGVLWDLDGREVCVDWFDPDDRRGYLRARAVS